MKLFSLPVIIRLASALFRCETLKSMIIEPGLVGFLLIGNASLHPPAIPTENSQVMYLHKPTSCLARQNMFDRIILL